MLLLRSFQIVYDHTLIQKTIYTYTKNNYNSFILSNLTVICTQAGLQIIANHVVKGSSILNDALPVLDRIPFVLALFFSLSGCVVFPQISS